MKNKISLKGKAKILEEGDTKYVIKPKNKSVKDLFEYLDSRNYSSHPKIIDESDKEVKYEYVDGNKNNSLKSLAKHISNLHSSTTYYKDVSTSKYKNIYNKLIDNVDYLKDFYQRKIMEIDNERYMSPSSYLLARNYSLFNSNLIFIEKEINKWYNLVKDKTKERVAVVHNNLKKDNLLVGSEEVLTGWDKFIVDTPVLDLYKLYKNEYLDSDFEEMMTSYLEEYKLNKEEICLFTFLISMPPSLKIKGSELEKVKEVKSIVDYLNRTNKLIKSGVFD